MTEHHKTVAVFVPHIGCPHRCSFCNQNAIAGASAPATPEDVKRICDAALSTCHKALGALGESPRRFQGGRTAPLKYENT